MIDRLIYFDRIVTKTELLVRNDNLFFEHQRLAASGLIENIAQTCAARMGYINRLSNESVKLGFIGAIRNLTILRTPREGELLTTTIEVKEEVFQMTLVDAVVRSGEEVLVTAEMKIAISDIDAQKD
jgi:predicted hotdog family 3-hydroxylacyl-ACP dehydratase